MRTSENGRTNIGNRTKRIVSSTLRTLWAVGTNVVASAILPTHSRRSSVILPAAFLTGGFAIKVGASALAS